MNAFDGAWRKGFIAGVQGTTINACPYEDWRAGAYDQVVTWSRAFIHAWLEGHRKGSKWRDKCNLQCYRLARILSSNYPDFKCKGCPLTKNGVPKLRTLNKFSI